TWSDFVGYSTVTTTHGPGTGTQSVSKALYYRGLSGDRTATGDGTRTASVTDSTGTAFNDQAPLRGLVNEESTLDGLTVVVKTIHMPNLVQTGHRTGSGAMTTYNSQRVKEAYTDTATWLAASSTWRWTRLEHNYDDYGREFFFRDSGAT